MTERNINISFREYSSIEELGAGDRELATAAVEMMKNAYAPYSKFHVGAAVRMSGGAIVRGSNQENAAYPSGLCAERTAMFAANATYPDQDMLGIAIAGGMEGELTEEPASPCGSCRQVMAQYQTKSGKDLSVIMVGAGKILKFSKVDDLLPMIFKSI